TRRGDVCGRGAGAGRWSNAVELAATFEYTCRGRTAACTHDRERQQRAWCHAGCTVIHSTVDTSPESMMRWSEVSSVRRYTRAVATIARSPGSRRDSKAAASAATAVSMGSTLN